MVRTGILLLLALAATAGAQSGEEALKKAIENRMNRGDACSKAQDYDGAIAEYSAAIKLDESYAPAWFGRGSAKHSNRDWDGAMADYDQAIKLDKKHARARYNRAMILAWRKDHAGAIRDLNVAIEVYPNWAAAYVRRGDSRRQLVDYAGAANDYARAAEYDPQNKLAYMNSAAVREDMGDFATAEEIYAALLGFAPDYAPAYRGRGRARTFRKDFTGAETDLKKAIELAPDDQINHTTRARMRMLMAKEEEALEDCDTAVKLKPKHYYPYYIRGLVLYNFGHYRKARLELRKAVKRSETDPDYIQLYLTLAKLRLKSYDDDRAIAELKEYVAAKKQPADPWYGRVVGFLTGELSEADFLAAAEGDTPKQTRERSCEAYFYAGTLRDIAGDGETAERYFRECVATGVSSFIEYETATVYARRR